MNKLLVTPKEAAAALGLSLPTIYGLINAGKLERIKFGRAARLRVADIERLIAAKKPAA